MTSQQKSFFLRDKIDTGEDVVTTITDLWILRKCPNHGFGIVEGLVQLAEFFQACRSAVEQIDVIRDF